MKNALYILFLLTCSLGFAQTKKDLTLEDIFKKRVFTTKAVTGLHSMNDGKTYVSVETDAKTDVAYVAKNSFSEGKSVAVLYKESDLVFNKKKLPISTEFSDDEKKVLITTDEEEIFRHSTKANYFVYDLVNRKITEVSPNGKQMFAQFSPDGTKVAFVRENNLFIKDLTSKEEKQITTDGKFNNIINGGTDWVYEEEFAFDRAFFWSPDNKSIAYYKFDESAVPEFSMSMYQDLYPSISKIKYPKAGEKNASVSIHIYNLANETTIPVNYGHEPDMYIPRIKWTNQSNTLCIFKMNRHQNKLEYLFANAANGVAKPMLTEQNKYYIDINDDLTFLKNGQFILTNESNGFNHLYLYGNDGKLIRQITKGNWEVTKLYGIDEKAGLIYYQSTEKSPLQRDVYSISLNGQKKTRISKTDGTNDATFSSDYSYFILDHSSASTPNYITLNNHTGKLVRLLEDNSEIKNKLEEYKISSKEFITIPTSQGVDLNAYIFKPSNFDKTKKYPVLMYVYGGPGSQLVADSWSAKQRDLWNTYLAQQGYLIVCVDNRGTGFRGADFKKMTYKQLGKYETIDQINAAKWLANQTYVDAKRIGIWGWSYGGYMSSLCITKGNGIFSTAIAVAPVTTWRFYDSIYTERYLQTPQENSSGYDENSPINFAKNLKGKFLLVHGTGDDNVHFQNSVMFSEALIQANKQFEQAYYPNKNHGIYGGNTTFHLYTRLTDFILKNL
ncbi:MAG: Dipeptidyl-peptidase [Sphingobacteriales bacterium]|nr:Dipeptidyl-peptidase [Sphingobacteriales bacterium]